MLLPPHAQLISCLSLNTKYFSSSVSSVFLVLVSLCNWCLMYCKCWIFFCLNSFFCSCSFKFAKIVILCKYTVQCSTGQLRQWSGKNSHSYIVAEHQRTMQTNTMKCWGKSRGQGQKAEWSTEWQDRYVKGRQGWQWEIKPSKNNGESCIRTIWQGKCETEAYVVTGVIRHK